MKTQDLMIGDWVNYRPGWINEETGKIEYECEGMFPIKVNFITPDAVQYDEEMPGGIINTIEAADYELFPIPLTPEILEKNGFEIRGRKKYFLVPNDPSLAIKREPIIGAHGNTFTIGHFWEGEKDFRWFIEISFVHELQHALRLCGIEKEIVL